MAEEKRKLDRRTFSYYMRVLDANTGKLVGHLTDISRGGFKLDCQKPLPVNTDYTLRLDLPNDIANKSFMVFIARTRWCEPDRLDPTSCYVGFQIINMSPSDREIFTRMFEKYGSPASKEEKKNNLDYLWR